AWYTPSNGNGVQNIMTNITQTDNSVLNRFLLLVCVRAVMMVMNHKPIMQRAIENEEKLLFPI
ncbi:hypothetical protein ACQR36_30315, partial [Rhodococcus erythropolis]|uniref:hypothetical protein n=1 Tax=Rhodococcus erythropolis TaxID=1833 RepID=UPI003D0A9B15